MLRVKMAALGTFVSCSLVIFFSPSKRMNDSKVGGAFITETFDEGGEVYRNSWKVLDRLGGSYPMLLSTTILARCQKCTLEERICRRCICTV